MLERDTGSANLPWAWIDFTQHITSTTRIWENCDILCFCCIFSFLCYRKVCFTFVLLFVFFFVCVYRGWQNEILIFLSLFSVKQKIKMYFLTATMYFKFMLRRINRLFFFFPENKNVISQEKNNHNNKKKKCKSSLGRLMFAFVFISCVFDSFFLSF